MEPIDVNGQWWLPETPDEKVSGRLTITSGGSAELTLIGALESYLAGGESDTKDGTTTVTFSESSIEKTGVYPRILGVAGNKSFTLEDCLQTHRSGQIFGGIDSQRINCGSVFESVHFESGEALRFDKIYVWMSWAAYWVMQSGLDETVEFVTSDDGLDQHSATTVKISRIAPETCAGQDGAEVTLGQSHGVAGDSIVERRLTQDFYFSIAAEDLVDLPALLEQASDLQDLVSIGTGRTAAYTSVTLRHPDVVHGPPSKKFGVPIEMYAPWRVVNTEPTKLLSHHDMFFSLPDLGGMPGVERWLTVAAKHRSELSRVMSTHYSKSMFVSDKVFNCAAALEAYDRNKYLDEQNFAARMKRCAASAGVLFDDLVGDVEVWVKAVKDARNDVAHHKARMGTVSTEHLFLGMSAYWLFVLCLLRDAQAPDEVFERIKDHRQFRWLQRRVAEALPPATPAAP